MNNIDLTICTPIYKADKQKFLNFSKYVLEFFKTIPYNLQFIFSIRTDDVDTLKLVECFKQTNNNLNIEIKLLNESGIGPTRNNCLNNAKGKFIYFADYDDDFFPENLKEILEIALNNNNINIFTGFNKIKLPDKRTIIPYNPNIKQYSNQIITDKKIIYQIYESISICRFLFRRQFLIDKQISFKNISPGEDFFFIKECIESDPRIFFIFKELYCYNSIGTKAFAKKWNVYKDIYNFIESEKKKFKDYCYMENIKSILFTLACNEDYYLDEWLQYNLKIGFSKIVVFMHNWVFKNIEKWKDYPIEFINVDDNLTFRNSKEMNKQRANQINKYIKEHSIDNDPTKFDYDLIANFDVDEFLYLKYYKSLTDFIEKNKNEYAVFIKWRLFGNNNIEIFDETNTSVLKRFTKCGKNLFWNGKHIITRLGIQNNFTYCNSPHHVKKDNKIITCYNDTDIELAHYRCKTIEEDKIRRKEHDVYHWNLMNQNDIENVEIRNFLYITEENKMETNNKKKSIVICWIGIGDYNILFEDFYNTFNKHFCNECDKTFFIFTDKPEITNGKDNCVPFVLTKPCTIRNWVLFRKFKYLMAAEEHFINYDYTCFVNANMRCQADVTLDELIKDKKYACVIHPKHGILKKDHRYLHPASLSSVKPKLDIKYKQAGFFVAESKEFLRMANTIEGWRHLDKANGTEIYAERHDEAYYNKYMGDHDHELSKLDALIYLCPVTWPVSPNAKIIQLDKTITFKENNLSLDNDRSTKDGNIYYLGN